MALLDCEDDLFHGVKTIEGVRTQDQKAGFVPLFQLPNLPIWKYRSRCANAPDVEQCTIVHQVETANVQCFR
jgi:hypothetical protein